MPPLKYPVKRRKRGRIRKTNADRKSLPKGFFLVKQIVNKAILRSRVYYCVIWNLPKGTKRNWIAYSSMVDCLTLMKSFDIDFRSNAEQYGNFALKYLRTINSVEVARQRKALENNEKVSRIVAFEPDTNTAVIQWQNNCISAVNLKEVTNEELQIAIGSSLFHENHWVVEYHLTKLFSARFRLFDNPKNAKEPNFSADDDFYKKIFDNFPNEMVKYWSTVRGSSYIFNPSFPKEDKDNREEHLVAVKHTICTNCGRIFEEPKESLVEHILVTGHIGWYALCLTEKEELLSLADGKKKARKAKNKHRLKFFHTLASAVRLKPKLKD